MSCLLHTRGGIGWNTLSFRKEGGGGDAIYVPPEQKDKESLVVEALKLAKEMNQSGRELKDIGLLISSSLNAIHAYGDAQGRTSRMIYYLLSEDFNMNSTSKLRSLLSEDGRDKLNIDPGRIQKQIEDIVRRDYVFDSNPITADTVVGLWPANRKAVVRFGDGVDQNEVEMFQRLIDRDPQYLSYAISNQIRSYPDMGRFVRRFPDRSRILTEEITPNLTSNQIKQIIAEYRELKKKYVEVLMESIADPDNHNYYVDYQGKSLPLKHFFEEEIEFSQKWTDKLVAFENRER